MNSPSLPRADGTEPASRALVLLVDAGSLADDPELPHLLSFASVPGLTVERHIAISESPDGEPVAAIGAAGTQRVWVPPLRQYRQFAAEIAARPGNDVPSDVIERALAFSFIAKRLRGDAVVSPAQRAFDPGDAGLLDIPAVVTVAEALALVGAHVRQRDDVPLGGTPLLLQQRTEVYPLTATVITPAGQEWWSACVYARTAQHSEWLDYAGAVFKRLGQALRGRDGVHETLRLSAGRAAILDALYHLDVLLTSGVGALDALARVAHDLYVPAGAKVGVRQAAWQHDGWVREVAKVAPALAAAVERSTPLGAALRVLTNTRNSIHGIPLDEYLYAERGGHSSRVEHRVMMSSALSDQLRVVSAPLGPLDRYGLHEEPTGRWFLNIGDFAEHLLAWTVEITGALMRAMLTHGPLSAIVVPEVGREVSSVEIWQRQACAALARVGAYPRRSGPHGLPAAPSLHRRVMATIHAARPN